MQSTVLGHFAQQDGFPIMGRISDRTRDSTQANCGCAQAGVNGRDKRKERALDTGFPTPTPPYAFLTAEGRKKCLDNADAVIHGATLQSLDNHAVAVLVSRELRVGQKAHGGAFSKGELASWRDFWFDWFSGRLPKVRLLSNYRVGQ